MSTAHPPTPEDTAASSGVPAESMAPPLQLQLTRARPDAVVLHLVGEVDETTVVEVDKALAPQLLAPVRVLVLDLSGVDFLCVGGLQLLGQAHRRATEQGRALRLVATNHVVCRALAVTALDQEVPCYTSVENALAPA